MEIKMATTKAISANAYKNNHGTAQNVGTSSTMASEALGSLLNGPVGSIVVDGDDTDKSIDANAFAAAQVLPTAQRVSPSLLGGSNVVGRSINKRESVITRQIATAIRANYFNRFTGLWSVGPSEVTETAMVSSDVAANPSLSVPGKLTYKLGNPVASTVNYAKKTN